MPESESHPLHIANFTIQDFPKTTEGQSLIAGQQVWCLDGILYQAYRGAIASPSEKVLTDTELEAVHDVDGSMDKIWKQRADRTTSRQFRKDDELSRRQIDKDEKELKHLQLVKARKEAVVTVSDEMPEVETLEFTKSIGISCDVCGKEPPKKHKNPVNWKRGHMMGAHKDKK